MATIGLQKKERIQSEFSEELKQQTKMNQLKIVGEANSHLSSKITQPFPGLNRKRRKRNNVRNYSPFSTQIHSIVEVESVDSTRLRKLTKNDPIQVDQNDQILNLSHPSIVHRNGFVQSEIYHSKKATNGDGFASFIDVSKTISGQKKKKKKKHNVRHARKKGHHREITEKISKWILSPGVPRATELTPRKAVQQRNYGVPLQSGSDNFYYNYPKTQSEESISENESDSLYNDSRRTMNGVELDYNLSTNNVDLGLPHFNEIYNPKLSLDPKAAPKSKRLSDKLNNTRTKLTLHEASLLDKSSDTYEDNRKGHSEIYSKGDIYFIERLTNKSISQHQIKPNSTDFRDSNFPRYDYNVDDFGYQTKSHPEKTSLPFATEEALLLAIPLSLVITLVALTLIVCCCCFKRRQDRNHLGLLDYDDADLNQDFEDPPPANCCGCRALESCCLPDMSYQLHRAEWVKRHPDKFFDPYIEENPTEDFHPSLYDLLSNLPPQRLSSSIPFKYNQRLRTNLRKSKSVELLYG